MLTKSLSENERRAMGETFLAAQYPATSKT